MIGRDEDNAGRAFLTEARRRLTANHEKIEHCLHQLDDAQVWWRPHPSLNSIANLVLHVSGNLHQWIVSGIGGAPDVRDRPLEFAEQGPIPKAELWRRLRDVVAEADAALARVQDKQLLEPRRIQGSEQTVLSAIFDSLTHLAGHTQEIVHLTRQQLGDAYQFAWQPTTPEQGAPLEPPPKEVAEATDVVFEEPGAVPEPVPPPVDEDEGLPPSPGPPLGDYVREIGQEFQDEEEEGKL